MAGLAFKPKCVVYETTADRLSETLSGGVLIYDAEANAYFGANGVTAGGAPFGGGGSGGAGGLSGQVQYNSSGALAGSSALTFAAAFNLTTAFHLLSRKTFGLDGSFLYTGPASNQVDNFTFTGPPTFDEVSVVYINPDASPTALTITSVQAPASGILDGRMYFFRNVGTSKPFVLQNMSGAAGALAPNLMRLGNNIMCKPGQVAGIRYDLADTKWHAIVQAQPHPHNHQSTSGEGGQLDAGLVFSTGAVPVTRGGTAKSVYTAGSILYADTTTTLAERLITGNAHKVLVVNAAATAPVYKTMPQSWPLTMFNASGIPASQDETVIQVPVNCTITGVRTHKLGAGTTVTWNLRHHADRSEPTNFNKVFTSDQTTTSGSGQTHNSGFSAASVTAGSWLWVNIASIDASIAMFHLSIEYTVDG